MIYKLSALLLLLAAVAALVLSAPGQNQKVRLEPYPTSNFKVIRMPRQEDSKNVAHWLYWELGDTGNSIALKDGYTIAVFQRAKEGRLELMLANGKSLFVDGEIERFLKYAALTTTGEVEITQFTDDDGKAITPIVRKFIRAENPSSELLFDEISESDQAPR